MTGSNAQTAHPLPGRHCGTCTLCCRLPEIDTLSKPANERCRHCVAEQGCMVYAERPQLCRDFLCLWMTDPMLGPDWEPASTHMMIYQQGPQITVLVDPDYPEAWQSEPCASALREWTRKAEARSEYIIVFVGDDVFKVEPA